ncbi:MULTISPECIES: acetate kinase [unclassified Microbacterium]|uniref:acetate/propionate family kinase n=1 Tax=unclassified Microbacterium TaxID=2609290 RepID=UPI001DA14E97|nr:MULTISPECIES: acetate kinase [unclassified Microbacterium]CAH0195180.1 Acetate kinase [Microbacterium sp. Bi121]HWK78312.1 acetate kinase [Microbacterium sp.]
MSVVLVINSGSSSLKYSLMDMEREVPIGEGLIERIGQESSDIAHTVRRVAAPGEPAPAVLDATHRSQRAVADHDAAMTVMLEQFAEHGPQLAEHPPVVVGHRVVHGGARFFAPTLIDDLIEINIEDLSVLAPLHNPGAVAGIRAGRRAFADVPHVAIFDTAFHQTLPPAAYTYAIERKIAERHRIRRYGFHGTSHKYVSEQAAAFVDRPLGALKQLVFHLGNGASVTAIDGGRSVETSMGMTPLEGLVMGTRSGDIDPAVVLHLGRVAQLDDREIDELLNKKSGMLGLAGRIDMRDILAGVEAGEDAATLAFDVYIHRLRAYAGAYIAQLGGVDVISFTAGVGENAAKVRADAMATLGFLGIEIDAERNEERVPGIRRISTDASKVDVLVVPTDEELEIARQAMSLT